MRKILALLAIVVSIFTLASCGNSHGASDSKRLDTAHSNSVPSSKSPTTLIGDWHQVNSNPDGWFTATVSYGSIQVNLRGRDSKSIYWMGSFETSPRTSDKFDVVSLPDPDARYTMDHSLMASTESKKTFSYNNGELSFVFSMAETSVTIHMRKTSPPKA